MQFWLMCVEIFWLGIHNMMILIMMMMIIILCHYLCVTYLIHFVKGHDPCSHAPSCLQATFNTNVGSFKLNVYRDWV